MRSAVRVVVGPRVVEAATAGVAATVVAMAAVAAMAATKVSGSVLLSRLWHVLTCGAAAGAAVIGGTLRCGC